VDFRDADGPLYDQQFQKLLDALRGPPGPPRRTGERKPPPDTDYLPEGALRRVLSIGPRRVGLVGGGPEVTGTPAGLDHALAQAIWALERARRTQPALLMRGGAGASVESSLADVGTRLGRAFLPPEVNAALQATLADATRLNCPLELGLEISDPGLADLPWEALRLPDAAGSVLALHPRVALHRLLPLEGSVRPWPSPAPCGCWWRWAAPRPRTPAVSSWTWRPSWDASWMPSTGPAAGPPCASWSRAAWKIFARPWTRPATTYSTSPVTPDRAH